MLFAAVHRSRLAHRVISLRCNNSAAIGGKADLAAIQRHVYGFTPKFIRLTLSPTDRAPPSCAGVKVKPCGCYATLTPLPEVARLGVPAPRECRCPTKGMEA